MSKSQENPVFAARRSNIRVLVKQNETVAKLGARLGYSNGTFISQLTGEPPRRQVSEKVARNIETKLGLAQGWLDTPQAGA
jgi:epoxyqueuosine reductase QueG